MPSPQPTLRCRAGYRLTPGMAVAYDFKAKGNLPERAVEIDRKLSQDITGSSRDRVVVRGVIEMARSLGLDVIAEGVETDGQLERLAEAGCALYQGYLCAPPLDQAALDAVIAAPAAAG